MLRVANWARSQHYKGRRPPWIRLYVEILDEFDAEGKTKKFRQLDDVAKLSFLMLLCLSSRYDGKVPTDDLERLKEHTGLRRIVLAPLIEAGYLIDDGEDTGAIRSASNALADRIGPDGERASGLDCAYHPSESESESESESDAETDTESEPPIVPQRGTTSRSVAFEAFWTAYPKKVGKQAAASAWGKHVTSSDHAAIMAALAWQVESEQWCRDRGQYIPNPATYLNQHRWLDEPTSAKVQPLTTVGMQNMAAAEAWLREEGELP